MMEFIKAFLKNFILSFISIGIVVGILVLYTMMTCYVTGYFCNNIESLEVWKIVLKLLILFSIPFSIFITIREKREV